MPGDIFLTALYLFAGMLFAAAAWLKLTNAPPVLLWFCAGVFLLVAGWRIFHMSKG